MASTEYLAWDSAFFGLKIGRSELYSFEEVSQSNQLLADARQQGYKLVYLFTPEHAQLPPDVSVRYDSLLVDTRLVYTRSIDESLAYENPHMHTFEPTADRTQLYELAYDAGKHSRYKLDPHFSDDEYRRLYRQWIDGSVDGTLADYVFVYKEHRDILGMITLRINGNVGIPGIMATNPACRGGGIGTAYFAYMLDFLRRQGVPRVDFITQLSNTVARRIYDRTNCQIISRTDIYHVWL